MKKIQLIIKYMRYFFTARNKYAVQAPFLYQFVNEVINTKTNDKNCANIEQLRKELCILTQEIQITDFGAGSSINDSKTRTVKDIAKNSAKNSKFGKLLYRIVKQYNPKNSIELGTSLGISTAYIASGNPKGKVFTFEGCPETAKIAQQNFKKLKLGNITITQGDFNTTLADKLVEIKTINLAFIDGNHQEKPTKKYFDQCLEYANNDTIFIFDDIHWSSGMETAWEYIKAHPKTTLSIDLFFVGIVFIKSELSKEHFTIRY